MLEDYNIINRKSIFVNQLCDFLVLSLWLGMPKRGSAS